MKRMPDRGSRGTPIGAREHGHVRDFLEGVRPGYTPGLLRGWTPNGTAVRPGRRRGLRVPEGWAESMFVCAPGTGDDAAKMRVGVYRSSDTPDVITVGLMEELELDEEETQAISADTWLYYEITIENDTEVAAELKTSATFPGQEDGKINWPLGRAFYSGGVVTRWFEAWRGWMHVPCRVL